CFGHCLASCVCVPFTKAFAGPSTRDLAALLLILVPRCPLRLMRSCVGLTSSQRRNTNCALAVMSPARADATTPRTARTFLIPSPLVERFIFCSDAERKAEAANLEKPQPAYSSP